MKFLESIQYSEIPHLPLESVQKTLVHERDDKNNQYIYGDLLKSLRKMRFLT